MSGRFRSRLAVSGAVVLVAAAVSATVAGIAGASTGPTAMTQVSLRYSCVFGSGPAPVTVAVTADFPTAVVVGQQVQPRQVRVSVRGVPRGAGQNGARVSGSASLTVFETTRGTRLSVVWQLRISALAGAGRITASGTPPGAVAPAPGTVTFTADVLALNMVTHGSPTQHATCVPMSGSSARLASIPIRAASRSAPHVRAPKGCGKIRVVGTGVPTCAYLTGYSDVAKLIGAVLLQPRILRPGLVNLDFAEHAKFIPGKLIEHSTAVLYYRGRAELPPVTATLLAFRFVPVTATLNLTELAPITIVSVSGITALPYPITVHASTLVGLRISNVKVNGVPLNVGPDCRTRWPIKFAVTGNGDNTIPPTGYTVPTGGPLAGMVTIPAFIGCNATSDNLNLLLTGTISGKGNFVLLTQGKLCGPTQPQNYICPPPVPRPIRRIH